MNDALGVLDVVLGLAVLGTALVAVLAPRRAAAVSVFLVFGVLLAVLWARLGAPDIALAEAVLGGGIAGALLVDALGSRAPEGSGRRVPLPTLVLAVLAGLGLLVALVPVMLSLAPEPGELPRLVADEMPRTGVDHGVTAVLLNYRTYDTLLEVAVLVVAVLAASSLTALPGTLHPSVTSPAPQPEPALKGLVAVLMPVALLAGAWFLVAGTSRPGGAFQAGAVLGAALVVGHLTGVRGTAGDTRATEVVMVGGLLVFVLLAVGTAVAGDGWLVLDPAWAGTVILALETALALSIAAALLRLFVAARAGLTTAPAPAGGSAT